MLEPRAGDQSFPAHLAARRSRLAERLTRQSTPVEATYAVRELLDELATVELNQRSTRERQIGERALRVIRDAAGFLQAVRAEVRWARPHEVGRRSGLPWSLLGLVAAQLALGVGVAVLLAGALQRGAVGGDGSLALGLVLIVLLVALQALTAYQLLVRGRAAPTAADDRPEVTLRVDGDDLLATLTQALVAVDQVERAAAASPEPAALRQPSLADYPELLRAIQYVCAARHSGDPRRAQQRAEGLRVSLEQYGVELHDEWTEAEPPPPELFVTQRSLDPSSRAYQVILPALTDARGVILPGRVAAPADSGTRAAPSAGAADQRETTR